ncbi:hypothetical protein HY972_00280 [Candidatus Kaiserbacteria bacterium]|nr:hypothetical protein [Candidatus Kaiserbacteria bacterium]
MSELLDVFRLIFPGVSLGGEFLTKDLREAFIVPLLEEGEKRGKLLWSAELSVRIVDLAFYQAQGTVTFGGEIFGICVEVHPPTHAQLRELLGPPANVTHPDELFGDFRKKPPIPWIFTGVAGEPYTKGIIVVMRPAERHN